jgi:hypothetical protein
MNIRATTEPLLLPGGGWTNVPIGRGFTPPIIDHYPEGPGYTRPFEPPLSWDFSENKTIPSIIDPGTSFKFGRYPRRNEMPMNPGSLNIPTIGAENSSILGTALLGLGGALAGKFFGKII